MRDRVMAASKAEGERMWTMPLEDDYKDYLKSPFADLANIGGRYGGAVTAACDRIVIPTRSCPAACW